MIIMKWLVVVLILAVVLIAGCAQISSIACKPSYVFGVQGGVSSFDNFNAVNITDANCKKWCYENDGVSSYKVENNICYCDVNNCSP